MINDDLTNVLPIAKEGINYWLFRTNSGEFYQTFKEYSFIAIGWNEISVFD